MHTIERQREQLEHAGLTHFAPPDRTWLSAQGSRHDVPIPYALLIPAGAGVGDVKRWPIANYAAIASRLPGLGLTPVIIGGAADRALGKTIRAACPTAIDLTGQTSFADIAALGAGAALALGNDTGPLHLAAAAGAPTIVLFSAAGVPEQAAPRGPRGEWPLVLREADIADLSAEKVFEALRGRASQEHGGGSPQAQNG